MTRDRYRRKRVRNMRRVLRDHGAPVPRQGCLSSVALAVISVLVNRHRP